MCNSETGDIAWCNENNSEWIFAFFEKKNKNPFLFKKNKKQEFLFSKKQKTTVHHACSPTPISKSPLISSYQVVDAPFNLTLLASAYMST